MQARIFCKTESKGEQTFYIEVGAMTYYLFRQSYRVSNRDFFANGVSIDRINNYSGVHSASVRRTLDKLPTYIRYVEKEYGIAVYNKTKKNRRDKSYRQRKADLRERACCQAA